MRNPRPEITSLFSWLSCALACIIGLALPVFYFGFSYRYESAALETEAEINARIVTRIINADPEMWRFEEHRLKELLARRPARSRQREIRRVLDNKDTVVVENIEPLGSPLFSKSENLLDSGTVVGKIEIVRSLRPLLLRTCLVATAGVFLGLAVFMTLRIFPLRALGKALVSLAEEKERAQVTLRSIGDGVISTDVDGNVLLINTAGEKLTGWTQAEAEGRHLSEVFRIYDEKKREQVKNPIEAAISYGKTTVQPEHRILESKNGMETVIAKSIAPIRDGNGGVSGAVLVFRDITQVVKLEEEILKAKKIESLGVLAGGIAHDFNNILTAVLGNISLALLRTGPDHILTKRLRGIEQACIRAKDLTQQLLTFSRGGAPVREATSLPELLRESAEFALSGSSVKCQMNVANDLWPAEADKGQVSQVIHNLVINAVEAMPTGGTITISAANAMVCPDDSLPLEEGKYIRVSVADQGHGIRKEYIKKIFDPYFTTKQKGSGLGLATCYSIIRNHNGYICVESGSGTDTVFSFYLPASPDGVVSAACKKAPLKGNGRILLMDDDEIVRETAESMLKHLGYEVVCSADGVEAVGCFKKALSSGTPFDAVILDLTVPGGMGGQETIGKLREMDQSVRAVVSSGYSNNSIMSEFRKHGFKGVISKPYRIEEMSSILSRVLSPRETA